MDMKNLNIISPDSIITGNYLGQGIDLGGQQIDFLVSQGFSNTKKATLVQGSFLIALKTRIFQHVIGYPQPENLNTELIYLLRVNKSKGVPDESSHLFNLSQVIINNTIEKLAPQPKDGASHQEPNIELMKNLFFLLECEIMGTFEGSSDSVQSISYSSDVGQISPAVVFHLFQPDAKVTHLILNGMLNPEQRVDFGLLRPSENESYLEHKEPVYISMMDIRGKRTAMFGKTRMGKSNVVKLVVQGMLDVTKEHRNVGQLIFDVNGEYANSNPQDGAHAIATAYPDRCTSYFLTPRGNQVEMPKLLRFNFYERTFEALSVMRELLPPSTAESEYVSRLLTCRLPNLARTEHDSERKVGNRVRKVMLFWTLLDICGFEVNPQRLQTRMEAIGVTQPFNPSFPQLLRLSAYQAIRNSPPPPLPNTFADMVTEISVVTRFSQSYQNDPSLRRNGQFIFDSDEEIMISFMFPPVGYSPFVLRPCLQFHSPEAGDFVAEILYKLGQGETVILDLGSANEQVIRYFSRSLSEAVFREQESKFVSSTLNNNFIQIYFEEAHMIFPPNAGNTIDVYSRFAKEGAKFNIGIVYSTQSPSTVNRDLLSQTENFFIGHLSSSIDTDQLAKIQHAFHNVGDIIMRQRTRGLLNVLTHSHRYVIPVQANKYNGKSRLVP
jgi:hypothetical protein